ncbi:MAG: hypothetical protein ACREHG_05725, partial [Candidatus Saccharimonadales bacterium]
MQNIQASQRYKDELPQKKGFLKKLLEQFLHLVHVTHRQPQRNTIPDLNESTESKWPKSISITFTGKDISEEMFAKILESILVAGEVLGPVLIHSKEGVAVLNASEEIVATITKLFSGGSKTPT